MFLSMKFSKYCCPSVKFTGYMQDMKFPWKWMFRCWSSEFIYLVIWGVFTSVSEELLVSIFRVEVKMELVGSYEIYVNTSNIAWHINPEDQHLKYIRECIQKFLDWEDNKINNNNNKHLLRTNTKVTKLTRLTK